jgi:hypothetical protein
MTLPSGTHLECQYPGAVAWGVHYPAPGRDHREAINGSAPGYVIVSDEKQETGDEGSEADRGKC